MPKVDAPEVGKTTVVLYVPEDTPEGCYAVGTVNFWAERDTQLKFDRVKGADSKRWVSYTFDYDVDMQIKVLAIPSDPAVAPSWSYQWGKNMDPENDLQDDNVVIWQGTGTLELENQGQPKLTRLADGGVVFIEIKSWATTPVIEAKVAETAAIKHPWNGGDWTYQEMTKVAEGKFEYLGRFGGNGVNIAMDVYGTNEHWYPMEQFTFIDEIEVGDLVKFTFVSEKLTIGQVYVELVASGSLDEEMPVVENPGAGKVTICVQVPEPLCDGSSVVLAGDLNGWDVYNPYLTTLVEGTTTWYVGTFRYIPESIFKVLHTEPYINSTDWYYQATAYEVLEGDVYFDYVFSQIIINSDNQVVYVKVLEWNDDACRDRNEAGTATFNLSTVGFPVETQFAIAGSDLYAGTWACPPPEEHVMASLGDGQYTLTLNVPAKFMYKYVYSLDGETWEWCTGANREMPLDLVTYDVEEYPYSVEPRNITVKAKVPAHWNDVITAWVWPTGGAGHVVYPTREGDWYVVTKYCTEMNIIFRNGEDWNGSENQTVDITGVTEDACFQLYQEGYDMATATAVDCEKGEEVKPWDAVNFYDAALWNLCVDEYGNVCEYPFRGYRVEENGDTTWVTDVNEDGVDDVVRECYLYVFSKGIYTDDQGLAGENDYLMLVTTASIYDGKYYYCIGDYEFSDDESDYQKEYEGRKYMRNGYATYTHFKPESYCKYYENVVIAQNNGVQWPSTQEELDQFEAEYGYWLGERDSYLYYFVNDPELPYLSLAGLVVGGDGFRWDVNESGATYLSYMNLDFAFFDNTPMGFATELDEETGNLNFKVPFEMAPYYERTISFGTKPQSAPAKNGQKGMPVLKGKVSEKQMLVNRAMNIAIKCAMK